MLGSFSRLPVQGTAALLSGPLLPTSMHSSRREELLPLSAGIVGSCCLAHLRLGEASQQQQGKQEQGPGPGAYITSLCYCSGPGETRVDPAREQAPHTPL